MYGKQFVAAALFLAVSRALDTNTTATDAAAADYEATPEPTVTLDDNAVDVTIPKGDWLATLISFEVFELDKKADIYTWAKGLGDDLKDYKPSGLVLVGDIDVVANEGDVVAIGLHSDGADYGLMAVMDTDSWSTVRFDIADGQDGVLDAEPDFLATPDDATVEDGFVENFGIGESFGQSYDGTTWSIWLYNVAADDWSAQPDSTHGVLYVEYDAKNDAWSSFTDSIDISLASGAASLLATATTVSAILSLM